MANKPASAETIANWSLDPAEMLKLLNGGTQWNYHDGDPYANLTMGSGQKWNQSGAGSGITLHRAGDPIYDPANPGSPDAPNILGYYQQDTYDVSGDTSALTGKPGSDMHANVQYVMQGGKLVPVSDPATWNWAQQNRAANVDFMTAAAMMAAGAAGGYMTSGAGAGAGAENAALMEAMGGTTPVSGAGAAVEGGGGLLSATGGADPATSAAWANGAGVGGDTLSAQGVSAAAAGNIPGAGITALEASGAAAAKELAKTVGSSLNLTDAAKIAAMTTGAIAGSQGTTSSVNKTQYMDPRLDKYVYGDGTNPGLLADANAWYQANKSGMNQQMVDGLNMKYNAATDPTNQGAFRQMVNVGSGLLANPIAGNPFTGGAPVSYANQGMGLLNTQANPFKYGK